MVLMLMDCRSCWNSLAPLGKGGGRRKGVAAVLADVLPAASTRTHTQRAHALQPCSFHAPCAYKWWIGLDAAKCARLQG